MARRELGGDIGRSQRTDPFSNRRVANKETIGLVIAKPPMTNVVFHVRVGGQWLCPPQSLWWME